ncbi:MAG: bifunctional UDP-sugar hydrolase/5'-nucleotidase [Bacteriovoracia bacterium]
MTKLTRNAANATLFLLACAALALAQLGCATGENYKPVFSEDDFSGLDRSRVETVVILGLSDLHGAIAPRVSPEDARVELGGAPLLAAYVQRLRNEFGGRLLVLDAGDAWQGTLSSDLELGAPAVSLYNRLGVSAATIGAQDLSFGVANLRSRLTQAQYPFVVTNLEDRPVSAQAETAPRPASSALVRAGSLLIGVIGAVSAPDFAESGEGPGELRFVPWHKAASKLAEEAQSLRARGANLIVLLAHAEVNCGGHRRSERTAVWTPQIPLPHCRDQDELPRLLSQLPAGTVDAVVAGKSHQIVHHWIGGVPIIMGGYSGQAFNLLYLSVDRGTRKPIPSLTRIEGPVPVCYPLYARTQSCDRPANESAENSKLVAPKLHGQEIHPDSSYDGFLAPVFAKTEAIRRQQIAEARRGLPTSERSESTLGNLIADAVAEETEADFSLINSGSIRAGLAQGPIHYEDLYRALPFDSEVQVVELTGKELTDLIRTTHAGARGFPSTHGLQIQVIEPEQPAPSADLDGDGKISYWEVNRLIGVRTWEGERPESNKTYRFATLSYLLKGGDDLGWLAPKLGRLKTKSAGNLRELVERYFKKHRLVPVADAAPGKRLQLLAKAPKKERAAKKKPRGKKKRKR